MAFRVDQERVSESNKFKQRPLETRECYIHCFAKMEISDRIRTAIYYWIVGKEVPSVDGIKSAVQVPSVKW